MSTTSPGRVTLHYRPDIDGMRALAVVPVCLFHAELPLFSGGFAGVDVFFVISGFLMASLIGRDLSKDRFSIADFYERRARRILPALFAVLLACLLAAIFLVPPKLFSDFGATLVGTALFASNLVFWHKSANYFDASTDWNPLLHTWSLGVEEQFYILFPLFLMLVWRWGARVRSLGAALLGLISLALSIWGTQHAPTATFYLLPTRAWELLSGALPALWLLKPDFARRLEALPPWVPRVMSVIGLMAVLGSLLWFDSEMAFPGAAALVPCAGVALLLMFGCDSLNPVTRLLSLAPLTFVGRVSYSLYLWHWPLLVFTEKYLSAGKPGPLARFGVLVVAFVAAYASWRWIEQPFRTQHGTGSPPRRVFVTAAAGTALFSVAGSFVVASDGWATRFPGMESVSLERQALASADPEWQRFNDSGCFVAQPGQWKGSACFLSHQAPTNALLWGDSFAAAHAYGVFHAAHPNMNVLQYTSPQCPPIFGYDAASRPQCAQFGERISNILRENNISTVILVANWSAYIKRRKLQYSDIGATTARLRSLHQRVILVGQSPVFPFAYPDEYFYKTFGYPVVGSPGFGSLGPRSLGSGSAASARDYYAPPDLDPAINDRIVAAAGANIDVFFDPLKLLCRQSDCLFKQGSSYLFIDYGHYSLYGSRMVATALMRAAGNSTIGGSRAASDGPSPGDSASRPPKLKSPRTGSRPG
jgi:peptidoglycan/LPS O-acetylase OafA/YrhL